MPDEKTGRLDEEFVVQMKGITKVYPNGVAANQGVDFNLRKGEIHALMGENGAGKSTLMKMLFGLEQPTSGEIWVNGEKLNLSSPSVAISHGIGMVHQHFMLVPSLTVAENMVLGMVPKKGLFIDHAKAVEITKEYADRFNLHVEPEAKVVDIPVGMKQKVEILKALVRGAKILILDEPTAVLTTQETTELFKELIHLKNQGYTIVFISHKLNEIMEVSDRVTVLRKGRYVGTVDTASTTQEELSRMMVGRPVQLVVEKDPANPAEPVLTVEHLSVPSRLYKRDAVKDVSFTARAGEIVCIAGIDGNGQTDLVYALTGLEKPSGGNQQKAIVAREIDRDKPLIVAVQPTRGLDVGAIEYIHGELVKQRDEGKAVLLVSLELDEVMNLSDRILVMYEGQIVGEFDPKQTTVEELGLYMAGAKRQEVAQA